MSKYKNLVHFFGEMDLDLSQKPMQIYKKAFHIAEACGYMATHKVVNFGVEKITLYGLEGEVFKLWFKDGKFKCITHSDDVKDAIQIPDGEGTGYGGYF